jgi:hypothetical protein
VMAENIRGTSYKTTPFKDVLPEVMAECGVRDLDELHSRYLEAGGEWDRESFTRHARGGIGLSLRSSFPPW